jgi:hypothetical protein
MAEHCLKAANPLYASVIDERHAADYVDLYQLFNVWKTRIDVHLSKKKADLKNCQHQQM